MSHKNMQPHKAENISFMSLSMFDTYLLKTLLDFILDFIAQNLDWESWSKILDAQPPHLVHDKWARTPPSLIQSI